MPSTTTSLTTLVQQLVPLSNTDEQTRIDLLLRAQSILNSADQFREVDLAHLESAIRRQLQQTPGGGNSALRLSGLISKLQTQPVLHKKPAVVSFLRALSSSSRSDAMPVISPSLLSIPSSQPSSRRTTSPVSPGPIENGVHGPPKVNTHGKTKAEILREYRAKTGKALLPEHLLLRDALFLLQGISGKYVRFPTGNNHPGESESKIIFVEKEGYLISSPTRRLILRLAELGLMYSKVAAFLNSREAKPSIGMIEQSLVHCFQTQLTDYYRLIAILESQMSSSVQSEAGAESTSPNQETGLTLKRLEVWVGDWRLKLKMMNICVEGSENAQGGALVSLIHRYTDNGDPFVREFTSQILEEISKPFFSTLRRWLLSGDLHDPFSEFFVSVDPELAHVQSITPIGSFLEGGGFGGDAEADILGTKDGEGGLRLWQEKYQFRREMLPSFLAEAFGKKIFSTGKSLNFIRYICHDSEWTSIRNTLGHAEAGLKYSDISGLEQSIDSAYQSASQRLFDVFLNKFKLVDHLRALKQYLMLGHGDFADQLMDSLGPSLSRPANTLYRHNLTTTLETAIRSSNAQHDPPDVLRRLDARMMEYSHGEIGWDVFMLEYKVDSPIDTVLDPDSMESYRKLFSHLWRIKRVASCLGQLWTRMATGSKVSSRVPELEQEWHQVRIVLAEMIHFIRQMQSYCQLEVIECSWKILHDFIMKKEGDLDGLIHEHHAYLEKVVKKVLLLSSRSNRVEVHFNQTKEIFGNILQFQEAADNLYAYSITEAARRDRQRDQYRGVHTDDERRATTPTPDVLPQVLRVIKDNASAFSTGVYTLVQELSTHSDPDCRILAARLSFSDFYKRKETVQKN